MYHGNNTLSTVHAYRRIISYGKYSYCDVQTLIATRLLYKRAEISMATYLIIVIHKLLWLYEIFDENCGNRKLKRLFRDKICRLLSSGNIGHLNINFNNGIQCITKSKLHHSHR